MDNQFDTYGLIYYSIPYILIYLISFLCTKYRFNVRGTLVCIVLIIFSSFRFEVGYDYHSYYSIIESNTVFNMEPLEAIVITLSHNLHYPQLFFIINSIITICAVYKGIKNISNNINYSLFIFICAPLMFLHSMSIVRFWTALSIIFCGSTYLLRDNSYFKFGIYVLIASLFHYSAIAGLLYIFLNYFNIKTKTNAVLLASSIGVSGIINSIFLNIGPIGNVFIDSFLLYAQRESSVSGMTKIPYLFLMIDIWFLYSIYKCKSIGKLLHKMITIYNVGCCIMFVLSFQPTLSSRLSRFFLVYIIVIIPLLLSEIKLYKKYINCFIYVLSFLIFMYSISIYNSSLKKYEYIPYKVFSNN